MAVIETGETTCCSDKVAWKADSGAWKCSMSYSRLSPERYDNIASRAAIRRGVGATIIGTCPRNLGTEGEEGALLRLWSVINGNFRTLHCHIVGSSLCFTMVKMDRSVR